VRDLVDGDVEEPGRRRDGEEAPEDEEGSAGGQEQRLEEAE
jgi:hypothetical protein